MHSDPSLPRGKHRHSPWTEELTEALYNSFTHPQTPRGLKSLLKFLPATRKGSERQTPTCLLGCISASSQAAAGAGRRARPRRSERETICFHRKQTSLIFQSRQALPPRSPFGSSRARTRPCCGAFLQEELEQPWCSAWYPRRTPLRAVTPLIVISAHSASPGDHPHQAGRQEKGTGNSPKSQHHLPAKRGWCQRDPLLQAASWKRPVNGHSAAHPLKTTGRISPKTRAILRICVSTKYFRLQVLERGNQRKKRHLMRACKALGVAGRSLEQTLSKDFLPWKRTGRAPKPGRWRSISSPGAAPAEEPPCNSSIFPQQFENLAQTFHPRLRNESTCRPLAPKPSQAAQM